MEEVEVPNWHLKDWSREANSQMPDGIELNFQGHNLQA
jgi:hypothetical protein